MEREIMTEKGHIISACVPHGQITNGERQRRQQLRVRAFLGELGTENIVIRTEEPLDGFLVTGFLPESTHTLEQVIIVLQSLHARDISYQPGFLFRRRP